MSIDSSIKHIPFNEAINKDSKNFVPLQKGDIIFTKIRKENVPNLSKDIPFMQWISQWILGTNMKNTSIWHQHASIVVEASDNQVWIAESDNKGVCIRQLYSHHSATLKENDFRDYVVLRPEKDFQQYAIDAAQYAERIGKRIYFSDHDGEKNTKTNPFSYWTAFKAMFVSASIFSFDAKKRVLKQYWDEKNQSKKATGGSEEKWRTFFCSYFIAHALQQAKAKTVLADTIKNESMPKNEKKKISEWAKREAKKAEGLEKKLGKFAYNAKAMAPYELYGHLVDKGIFKPVVKITPIQAQEK